MLTSRGLVFLLIVLVLAALGLAAGSAPLAVTGLALLLWFTAAWILFAVRVDGVAGRLELVRRLHEEGAGPDAKSTDRGTLWAGQTLDVDLEIRVVAGWGFPLAFALDRPPPLASRPEGDTHAAGKLTRAHSLRIAYRLHCPRAGRLRFEGVRLLLADLQGFFARQAFVPAPREMLVLPPLVEGRDRRAFRKRHNLLPLVGSHLHRRTGSGTDLLDVRDYQPGDPPKLVAWKLSARRDRLMTREYESEVPVRCTVFIDVGDSVRRGELGANPLARFVELAAVVIRSADDSRDLTGLVLVDGPRLLHQLRPARGRRHLMRATRALAEAADLAPREQSLSLETLLPLAYGLAQDISPDLVAEERNAFPWWLPLWSPQPVWAIPRPKGAARSVPGRVLGWLWRRFQELPMALQTVRRSRFSPTYHRMTRYRKKTAAVLALRHDLGPGGIALLMEDDDLCRRHLLRFLAEHQVPIPPALFEGPEDSSGADRMTALARSLTQAVGRARENEVFVLMADILGHRDHLDPLLAAVRLAKSKHHIVLPICAWPEGIPLPGREPSPSPETADPRLLLRFAAALKMQQAFAVVRRKFAGMGVACLVSAQSDGASVVLQRLQSLRRLQGGSR